MNSLGTVYLHDSMNKYDKDAISLYRRRNKQNWAYNHIPLKIFEASVGDYHEFEDIKNNLKLAGLKYKYEEVGCDWFYKAVFWLDKKPVEFIKLLKKQYSRV